VAIRVPKAEQLGIDEPDWSSADVVGDRFVNDGNTVVWLRNNGAGPIDVLIQAKRRDLHGILHDQVVTVAAGAVVKTEQFAPDRFNDGDGRVAIGYASDPSDLELVVVRQQEYFGP
jgi:hypothetical protein